jgi:cytochrome c-type biogenesis protein CcsB
VAELETTLVRLTFGLYLAAALIYVAYVAARRERVGQFATAVAWLGVAANTAALVARGMAAGRVPYVTMYEYLMAFAWAVAALYLIFEWRFSSARSDLRPAGSLAMLLALGLLGYGTTQSPYVEPLMPVLKSNWLIFHVFTAIIGYGAAGVATALAILYLARSRWPGENSWLRRLPSPADLDQAVYRGIAFAFPFLALVNITGAIWAYDAWGRYWGWDPKETWSLITWLVYAFYLHARLRSGWRGAKVNVVAIVGFATVMFTFIGVSLLSTFSQSVHSYAGK